MPWLRRFVNTIRSSRLQRDIDREIAFHIREREDELCANGLPADEARRRARRQFGNASVQRERTRDVDTAGLVDALLRNVRLALRGMRRTPGFSAAVVLTLALGIGANSAVFSAIDAVLLRPLPFPDSDRLVQLTQTQPAAGETHVAPVRLRDWNRLNSTFEGMAGYFSQMCRYQRRTSRAGSCSAGDTRILRRLGVRPAVGRTFIAEEHLFAYKGPEAVIVTDGAGAA